MIWFDRADAWMDRHPNIHMLVDGLTILALGVLFLVVFQTLIS